MLGKLAGEPAQAPVLGLGGQVQADRPVRLGSFAERNAKGGMLLVLGQLCADVRRAQRGDHGLHLQLAPKVLLGV